MKTSRRVYERSGEKGAFEHRLSSGRGTLRLLDYWRENISGKMRFTYPKQISYGLRFLKKNVPMVDILEYPSWSEYKRKLDEGYDVMCLSFFTHEIPRIKKMVKALRKYYKLRRARYGPLKTHLMMLKDTLNAHIEFKKLLPP